MRVLADGGSTKIDWLLIHDDNTTERFVTCGINPSILSPDVVEAELRQVLAMHKMLGEADKIQTLLGISDCNFGFYFMSHSREVRE